jgi:hypothetical protein
MGGVTSDKIMEIRGAKQTGNPTALCVSQSLQPVSARRPQIPGLFPGFHAKKALGIPRLKLYGSFDGVHDDVSPPFPPFLAHAPVIAEISRPISRLG